MRWAEIMPEQEPGAVGDDSTDQAGAQALAETDMATERKKTTIWLCAHVT